MNSTRSVVLVVEDDPLILIHSTLALEDAGYRVVAAADAESALARAAEQPAIDAVFADVELRGGGNGVAIAEAVRAAHPGSAVVITSGHAASDVAPLPRGSRFLAKPYTAADVREALDAAA